MTLNIIIVIKKSNGHSWFTQLTDEMGTTIMPIVGVGAIAEYRKYKAPFHPSAEVSYPKFLHIFYCLSPEFGFTAPKEGRILVDLTEKCLANGRMDL